MQATPLSVRRRMRVPIVVILSLLFSWELGADVFAQSGRRPSFPRPGRRPKPSADKKDPGQYHFELAKVHQRFGAKDEANAAFAKAAQLAKDKQLKSQVLSQWGEWLLRAGKSDQGKAKIEEAMKLTTDQRSKCRLALTLARFLDKAGKADEAAAQYEYVMTLSKDRWMRQQAERQFFWSYKKAGKLGDLIKRYEAKLAKNPKDESALSGLMTIYSQVKPDPKKAMAACEKLAKLKPDDVSVARQLAELHLRARQPDKAVAVFEYLAKAEPRQANYYYTRIIDAYLMGEQNDKAIAWAKKLVAKDAKNTYSWSRMGQTCLRAGRNDEAIKAFKKAIEIARTQSERESIELRLAGVYRQLNRDHDAIAVYGRLAKSAKSEYTKKRAKQQLFDLYAKKGMLDKVRFDQPAKQDAPK